MMTILLRTALHLFTIQFPIWTEIYILWPKILSTSCHSFLPDQHGSEEIGRGTRTAEVGVLWIFVFSFRLLWGVETIFPPHSGNNNTDSESFRSKDWFLRAWVVQETGLGKTCVLNWGPHSIPFVDVVELMSFVEWRSDLAPSTGNLGETLSRILDSFHHIQSGFVNLQSWMKSRPVLNWRLNHHTSKLFMNVILGSRKLKASDKTRSRLRFAR